MDMVVLPTLHTRHVWVGVGVSVTIFSDPIVQCCSSTNSAIRSVAFRLSEAFRTYVHTNRRSLMCLVFVGHRRITKQRTIVPVGIRDPDFGLQDIKDLHSNFVENRKTDIRLACQ
jgi:hypothetical protein